MIVDYAEQWAADELLTLVDDMLPVSAGLPVRLVLLARPAGLWWTSLSHQLHNRDVAATALPLPSLASGRAGRSAVFTAARDAFAAALGVLGTERISAPALLAGEGFQSVLTIHMAALVAVHRQALGATAAGPPAAGPPGAGAAGGDPVALAGYLLEREHAHWQRMHASGAISTRPDAIAAVTYIARLTGHFPIEMGRPC